MKTSDGKIINERKIDWTQVIVSSIAVLFLAGVLYATVIDNTRKICELEKKVAKIDVLVTEVGWIKDTMKKVYDLK